jgi:TRAP-type transport system small permease protein
VRSASLEPEMVFLERICKWLAVKMNHVGAAAVFAVMFLTCGDIFGRLFYKPIEGVYELVGMLIALGISFALPHSILIHGHVAVTLVVKSFSLRHQAVIEFIVHILSAFLFSMLTWETIMESISSKLSNEASVTLEIPSYILESIIAFALLISLMMIVLNLYHSTKELVKK